MTARWYVEAELGAQSAAVGMVRAVRCARCGYRTAYDVADGPERPGEGCDECGHGPEEDAGALELRDPRRTMRANLLELYELAAEHGVEPDDWADLATALENVSDGDQRLIDRARDARARARRGRLRAAA